MAGILKAVGFPFLANDAMPDTIYTGTVYTWKENFIQGAGWKAQRLTLFDDGALVWDEPQSSRLKGCEQLHHIFGRIGIGTLYNSVVQQKAAAKHDLTILEYGLLLPFSRGDGGLELSQFAVTAAADIHQWMEAFARQMNVSNLLEIVVEYRLKMKPVRGLKRESLLSDLFWLDDTRMTQERAASLTQTDSIEREDRPVSMLDSFKAPECADIWREFQETYNLQASAAPPRQRSAPANSRKEERIRRVWSAENTSVQCDSE